MQKEPTRQDGAAPPVRRHRRATQPALQKSRQANFELLKLNLDVWYLVCSSLHPVDLLNLARTCKFLRRFFMSRSSAFIWRAARLQIRGIPDCPADLSEPAYANLAFYARCRACDKYAATIYWRMRRRYCAECRFERLVCEWYFPKAIVDVLVDTKLDMVIDKEPSAWYDRDLVNSVTREYERSTNKEQFLRESKDWYSAIGQHGRECEAWKRKMASERRLGKELLMVLPLNVQ